jgi:riboflavin synthase
MFTGLIKEIGNIKTIRTIAEGLEITIESKTLIDSIDIDDSVALDGACQTVVAIAPKLFTVQAVATTLAKTTLSKFKPGYKVNLELALRASDRLAGHFVQGHVNSKSTFKSLTKIGENYILEISLDETNRRYVINEGSVTLNGISLTVASINDFSHTFSVSIIPHTFHHTNLINLNIGDEVNVEFDVISKYVENMLKYKINKNNITKDWLSAKGF